MKFIVLHNIILFNTYVIEISVDPSMLSSEYVFLEKRKNGVAK